MKIIEAKNYNQAYLDLSQAVEKDKEVALINQTGSHKYMGFLYVKAMMNKLRKEFNNINIIFDAADDAMAAISAITGGFKKVIYRGDKKIYSKLNDIALDSNVELIKG